MINGKEVNILDERDECFCGSLCAEMIILTIIDFFVNFLFPKTRLVRKIYINYPILEFKTIFVQSSLYMGRIEEIFWFWMRWRKRDSTLQRTVLK